MALAKLNLEGLAQKVDLSGQNVLVRVDLNVPLAKASSIRKKDIHVLFWEGGGGWGSFSGSGRQTRKLDHLKICHG